MRSKAIAFATGAVLGCSSEPAYQWGMPYQPGVADDDDENQDASGNEASGGGGEEASTSPNSGPDTTSGPGPMQTDASTVADASGSSGQPGETGESPYQGGWDVGDCQDEMQSEIADFVLGDSYGDQVRLYDFCHKAIMLTAGSFW